MSEQTIINTVKLEFPAGLPRPSWAEIAGFLKALDIDTQNMETVYKMGYDRSVRIKYKTEDAMKDALRRNRDGVLFHYSSGQSVELRMMIAGINIQYVRVFDVPPEVDDKDVTLVLGKYGNVHRTQREKFPAGLGVDHLHTGVRGIFMEVNCDIPPSLDIGKWKAKVFYDGLREKCFVCQMEGHRRNNCPSVKPKEKKKQTESTISYAGVVEAGSAASPNRTEIVEEDIIEIVEEEILEQRPMEAEKVESKRTSKYFDGMDAERLDEIDRGAAELLGLENFSENIGKLSDMIAALPNGSKTTASERRAQFASSGSTELRPKKSARKYK